MNKILAISGSTREQSSNLNVIKAIEKLGAGRLDITVYSGLTALPHFNPDKDTEDVAVEVAAFRQQLKAADGVLICTPEYARGLPGTLKNALDWTVSSASFSGKPVVAITAGTMGQDAHASLLGTLKMIEAIVPDSLQLLLPYARTKINAAYEITDAPTLLSIQQLIDAFVLEMERAKQG